jgi:tetratricopeptide (TPR) repeat protein/CHAT domain-containing protein
VEEATVGKTLRGVLAYGLLATALLPPLAHAQADKPPEWTPAEKELADRATKLNAEGFQLYRAGKKKEAVERWSAALELRRKLYPPERFPDGHPDLALSLHNLGAVLLEMGEPAKALPYDEQVLTMRQKLYPRDRFPDGHPHLALSLNNLGMALYALGDPAKALSCFEQALAVYQKLYPPERFPNGHPDLAASLDQMGGVLQRRGEPVKALPYYEQALAMQQKLYPKERFPNGHPLLALRLNNVGLVLQALGEPARALPYLEQALAINEKLYPRERFPDGHPDLAAALNNMGLVLQSLGDHARALPYDERALAMCQKLYPAERFPDGYPDLATSLHNLGAALEALGEPARALPSCEQALAMRRKLYPTQRFPKGHAELAQSLNGMGSVLHALGESAAALPYYEQALAMNQKLYPPQVFKDGHPELAASLSGMGFVLLRLGELAKALTYDEQALAMYQKLYPAERFPDGHPDLATGLNNLGDVLRLLGKPARAWPYHEQAVTMCQKLYPAERFPNGHPALATDLNNLGAVLEALGEPARALPYYEQALAMYQKLYPADRFPDGHPYLALSLNNLGGVLEALGEPAKALPYYEQALGMWRKLYPPPRFPDGHPNLATGLHNLGVVLRALGKPAKALSYYEQALATYRRLGTRELGTVSEAEALAYRAALPPTRDGYLAAALQLSPPAVSYELLWHTRGGLLPLLQARHQAILVRLAGSAEVRQDYDQLVAVRRQISRLQKESPREGKALEARDKELTDLNDEQDRLERRLTGGLPQLKRLEELARKGPADLAAALPKDAAFVDFFRYSGFEKDKAVGRRYLAFVVLPGQEATLVPLGGAKEIDDAVTAWRAHLDAGEDGLAPAKLRGLVWDKIAHELPAATKVVYLCPDGDLARLPFVALPGSRKGTVLLEDYALAAVPSGPWLLEQLLSPPKAGTAPDRILAVGGVAYGQPADRGKTAYKTLAGTGRELEQVLEAFGQQPGDGLAGEAATTAAVREQLPKARYAHFATHGYFDARSLSAERQRLKDYLDNWTWHEDSQRVGLGLRNPAGYVGLVLAGANDPSKAGPDGGILTGLGVVDLPLEGLRLCVLSACDTGLGELTEAEGVLGLQRAFHAAGCPNVIGSLWQVDDEATAALMTQFYHELRRNHRSPLAALREAQLTLYRHPKRMAALAGSRGRIDQEDTVKLGAQPPEAKPGATARTTPVKLWAAFVLSGGIDLRP